MIHPTYLGTRMAGKKRDLVIHFDEQLGKVIVCGQPFLLDETTEL